MNIKNRGKYFPDCIELISIYNLFLHPDKEICIFSKSRPTDRDDEDTRYPHRREEGEEYTETEHETESLD